MSRCSVLGFHLDAHLLQHPRGEDATGADDDGVIGDIDEPAFLLDADSVGMDFLDGGFQ